MPNENSKTISIQEAAEILKVSRKTLRRWEKKEILIPTRTPGGHRRYVIEKIEKLKKAKGDHRLTKKIIKKSEKETGFKFKEEKVTQKLKATNISEKASGFLIEKRVSTEPRYNYLDILENIWKFTPPTPKRFLFASLAGLLTLALITALFTEKIDLGKLGYIKNLGKNFIAQILPDSLRQKTDRFISLKKEIETSKEINSRVLAATSFSNLKFNVNVDSFFAQNIAANGGGITTNQDTFDLINTTAITLNMGGEATDINIGATTGTTTVNNTLNIASNLISAPDDLLIDPAGEDVTLDSDLILSDTFTVQVGGKTATAYNAFANSTDAPEESAISSDNDVYIGGDLEVDGTLYATTISGLSTYSSWYFATDGTTQDAITSGDILNFVSGTGISVSRSADDTLSFGVTADSLDFTELSDSLSLDAATSITNATTGNLTVNLTSTGDFAIQDGGTAYVTFTDTGAVEFADGSFLDLANISHNDTALQGLRLPQAASFSSPSSGEGLIAWDTYNDAIAYFDGSNWNTITGGGVTGSGASGRVAFWSSASAVGSNASFYWDDSNELLGIGTGTPTSQLTVSGTYSTNPLVVFNETGGQTIFEAQSSSSPVARITNTGNLYLTGTLNTVSGNLTIDSSGGTTTINDSVNLGSGSTGINVATSGLITDIDSNLVLGGTVDIGSTTTGLRVTSAGSLSDIDSSLTITSNVDAQAGLDVTGASLTVGGSYSWTTGGVITAATTDTINTVDISSSGAISDIESLALTSAGNTWSNVGNLTISGDLAVNGGDITTTATTLNIDVGNGGIFQFRDSATNVLASLTDGGSNGILFLATTGSAPGSCTEGEIYTDSGSNNIYYCEGGNSWVDLTAGAGTGFISGSGSNGQVTFWTASDTISGTNNFFWDATNELLGVGAPSPEHKLHVSGGYAGNALVVLDETYGNDILAASDSGTTVARITNNGDIYLTGTLNTVSGNLTIDSAGGTTTISDNAVIAGTSDLQGFISNSTGNVTIDDTVILGDDGTGIQIATSGQITDLDGSLTIASNLDATAGVDVTGANLTVGGSNFYVAPATGNIVTAGTITLPNTNTLTGVSGYTRFSQGISVGGLTTYYIDSSGHANLNNITGAGTLDINGGGTHDIAGTLNLSGGTLTSTADLTINPAGGDLYLANTDTLVIGGHAGGTSYNIIANAGQTSDSGAMDDDNDLYIGGDLEIDGTLYSTSVSGAYTQGSVIFAGASGVLTQDNPNFFWDDTNNLLGLGTSASPEHPLHISGGYKGNALVVLNETAGNDILAASSSAGTTRVRITNAGNILLTGTLGTVTGGLTIDSQGTTQVNDNLDATAGVDVTGANLTVGGANFTVAPATGNITTAGTITLPNTNTLSGVSGYLQLNNGLAVGGNTTYYFNSSGNLNANQGTFGSTLTANGIVNLGDGGDAISISGTTVSLTSNSPTNNITLASANDISFDDLQLSSAITMTDVDASFNSGDTAIVDAINSAYDAAIGSGGGIWNRTAGYIYPTNVGDNVGIGTQTTAEMISKLYVTNDSTLTGKALAILNQEEDQDILTASYSGTPRLTVTNTGNLQFHQASSITTTTGNLTIDSAGTFTISDATDLNATLALGGDLTFDAATPAIAINGGETLTITDGSNTLMSLADGGNVGNLTVTGDATVQGTTGLTLSGNDADLTFSGTDNHDITASGGTLRFGAATLTGTITGGSQNITSLGTLDFGTNNVSVTGTTVGLTTDTDLLSLASGALTVNGTGTFTGNISANSGTINTSQTTLNIDVANTGTINFRDGTYNLLSIIDDTTYGRLGFTLASSQPGSCTEGQIYADDDGNLYYCEASNTWVDLTPGGGGGVTVSGTPAAGQAAYWVDSGSIAGNSDFFWDNANELFGIGTNGSPITKLHVSGNNPGKALVIFDETGADSQNIFTASASGTTVMNLDRSGNLSLLSEGELRLYDSDNSNYTGFQAPAAVAADRIYTLPTGTFTADYVLTWQNGNLLEWKAIAGVGGVGDITAVGNVASGDAFTATSSANTLWFEGTTADTNELLLTAQDPTYTALVTIPAQSGYLALIQPQVAQPAASASSVLWFNETNAGSPNLIEMEVGGTDTFVVQNDGDIVTLGDLAINGDDITSDSNLTINATGYVRVGDTNTPSYATADDDLYVEGNLEIGGTLYDSSGNTIAAYWTQNNGVLYPTTTSDVLAATSGATTVATFTATGTNTALQAGGSTNYISVDSSGNLTLANAEVIGNASDGIITLTGAGGSNDTDLYFDLDNSGYPIIYSNTNTAIGIDDDLVFIGAQSITTSTGDLTIAPSGNLDINAGTIDLSTQATNIDLINSNAAALTFETNLLRLDTAATSVEVTGTTTLGDGGTSNYAQFSSTGDLTFAGTANTITGPGANELTLTNTSGQLQLITVTSGELDLTSAGLMDINAGANLDIDVTGTLDLLSTGAFSLDGTGASNVTATSGNLTLSTLISGTLALNSAGAMDIDSAGAITIDSGGSSDITITAADDIFFNDAVQTTSIPFTYDDDGLETPTSAIVDAINEAYAAAIGGGGGVWNLSSGVIYPTTISNNVAIGTSTTAEAISKLYVTNDSTATGKALVILNQEENRDILTASYSGTPRLTITNAGNLQFHQASTITTTTGNLTLDSAGTTEVNDNLNANAGVDVTGANLTVGGSNFTVAPATGNIVTAGTLTLPNTNTLTGVSGYTRFSQGISVGGLTTYYIDSSGHANLNNITGAGTLDINGGGTHDIAGTLNLSGNTLTSTGDLTVNPGGGDLYLTDTDVIVIGGHAGGTSYNIIANSGQTSNSGAMDDDNDLYIGGDLEVDGTLYSNSVSGNYTQGSVIFAGASGVLTQDNPNFFWDDTTNVLGIGDNTPESRLDIEGSVNQALVTLNETGGSQDILTASASSTTVARITNAGNLYITGTLNTVSGNLTIDSAGGSTTISDNLVVTGTSDLQGAVSNSTGNLVLNDDTDIGGSSVGIRVSDTDGSLQDIDGNLVLLPASTFSVYLGNASTGLGVSEAGVISDLGDTIVNINDNLDVAGNITATGTTGLTLSGSDADITFSGASNHDITASSGTLRLGATTLLGTILANSQNITGIATANFGGGNVNITGTTIGLTTDTDLLSLASNALTVNGDVRLADTYTLEVGGLTSVAYNAFANSGQSTSLPTIINSDNDVYIGGDLEVDGTIYDASGNPIASYWTQSSSTLYPTTIADNVGIGSSTPANIISKLYVTNDSTYTGKALAILNQTENQDILAASSSTNTVARITNAGNLYITGTLNTVSGNLTIDSSGGTTTIDDIVNLGSATTGINVTTAGVILDIDGNLILDDTTDIGSATTGINVTTAGVISDIDGNLVLNDTLDLGSETTGLRISTDGVILDIDDSAVSVNDDLSVSGDLTVTGGDIQGPSGENIDLGEATADTTTFYIAGAGELSLSGTALYPTTDSGLSLGTSANQFADLYLDGGNINLYSATDIDITDKSSTSFTISEAGNLYLTISTVDDSEHLEFGNTSLANLTYEFAGLDCSGYSNGGSLTTDANGNLICAADDGGVGGGGVGTSGSPAAGHLAFFTSSNVISGENDLYYDYTNNLLGIGTGTSPVAKLDIEGAVTGQALVQLNETGDQAIFTASASGAPVFTINREGSLTLYGISSSGQTTEGTIYYDSDVDNLYVYTTAGWVDLTTQGATYTADNALTLTGTEFDWGGTLSESTTITQGNYDTIFNLTGSGNFRVQDNGTDILFISEAGKVGIGNAAPVSLLDVDSTGISTIGKALAIFNQDESQDILTASSSGSTRFTLGYQGDVDLNLATTLTSGNGIDVDWAGATTLAGAGSGLNITASDISGNGQNFYGINISDLGTAGGGNEYAIYQQGTDWDYGAYFTDDVYTDGRLEIGNSTTELSGKAALIVNQEESEDIFTASASGTTAMTLSNAGDLTLTSTDAGTDDIFSFVPYSGGAAQYTGTLTTADLTGDRTWTLPDTTGTIGLSSSDYWQLNSKVLSPGNNTWDLAIGGSATSSAKFHVAALTGALTATTSASTTTAFEFGADTMTTGTGINLTADALTSGYGLSITSTSSNLSTGRLLNLDWSPLLSQTATGDLFRLNIGANGNVTNLFHITDNGSTVFRVSETQIESAVPHAFTAAGDVKIAYDLLFTNQTSSNVKTNASLTLDIGESHESNNLIFKTYNTGDVVFNNETGGNFADFEGTGTITFTNTDEYLSGKATLIIDQEESQDVFTASKSGTTLLTLDSTGRLGIGDSTPDGLLHLDSSSTSTFGKALMILNHDESQDILTASAGGTTVFTVDNDGDIAIGGGTDNDDDVIYFDDGANEYLMWDNDPGDFVLTDDLTMPDDSWIGAGSADARIIFDAGNDINLTGANVGINQATPLYQLHVTDTDTATGSAMIENLADVGANAVVGLIIKLGSDTDNPGEDDRFINFMQGDGLVVGKIYGNGDGSVTYGGNGVDFAEYMQKAYASEEITKGNLLCLSNSGVTKCTASENRIVGAVSTSPVVTGGLGHENDPAYVLTGLIGQIKIDVTSENGKIIKGDPIAISSTQVGKGTKALSSGRIVGYALEDADGDDQILVYVNPGWHEPSLAFSTLGKLNLTSNDQLSIFNDQTNTNDQNFGNWKLEIGNSGQFIDRLGAYAQLIAANIKAGYLEVNEAVADKIISRLVKTEELAVDEISPNERDLVINLDSSHNTSEVGSADTSEVESGFGKLLIKGQEGEVVASIDAQGNATFSGELASDSLRVEKDASIAGELRVGKIYADEVISLSGPEALRAGGPTSPTSLTREDIEALLAEVEADQNLLTEAQSWDVSSETDTAMLNELVLENLYVTGTSALDSLSVTESVVVGADLVISSPTTYDQQLTTSIDTLNAPLSIQSSASQPLHLMAGLVQIDTQGNVSIAGDLAVKGTIESSALTLKANRGNTSMEQSGTSDSSGVGSGFGKLLSILNEQGTEVAGITASGSATFVSIETDRITLRNDPEATSSATFAGVTYQSKASAGSAEIPAGTSEVTIQNPNITENSLVFVTPTSSPSQSALRAGGLTLYIKEQSEGKVIVGFNQITENKVKFNWWLVDLVAQSTSLPR